MVATWLAVAGACLGAAGSIVLLAIGDTEGRLFGLFAAACAGVSAFFARRLARKAVDKTYDRPAVAWRMTSFVSLPFVPAAALTVFVSGLWWWLAAGLVVLAWLIAFLFAAEHDSRRKGEIG